jgi:hypothetical protein
MLSSVQPVYADVCGGYLGCGIIGFPCKNPIEEKEL